MIPPDWDSWLATQGPQAGFCQTAHWAKMREYAAGARPYVVEIAEGGVRRVAGLLLHEKPGGSMAGRVLRMFGDGTLTCTEGPVVAAGCETHFVRQWFGAVDDLARLIGASKTSVTPRLWANGRTDIGEDLVGAGWRVQPWETALVDLTSDEAALLAGFDHAARKGVHKCERAGLVVETCESWDDYQTKFVAPFEVSFGHERTARRPPAAARAIWDISIKSGCYRYYIARLPGGEVQATLGVYIFNRVATEIMSGRTPAGLASGLPAQDLLHWTAVCAARRDGAQIFDLAGFSPAPANPKEEGIRRFKLKWGGRVVPCPRLVRSHSNFAACVIGVARTIKSPFRRSGSSPGKTQSAR